MEMNFCRRCGGKLTNVHDHVYACADGHTIYANGNPTVGIFFVTDHDTVLLARRGIEPHKGMLDSFGGFIDGEETAEHAITRELLEETGLEPSQYDPPQFLCTAIGHYPYEGDVLSTFTLFFFSRLKPGVAIEVHDDVAEMVEVDLAALNPNELHDDDVRQGILKLQQLLKETS